MNLIARSFRLGLLFTLLSIPAVAEDSVVIRYLGGYPPPNQSTEWINLRVARLAPPPIVTATAKQEIDRFFEQVEAVLKANRITQDWQLAIPDAPSIEITLEINGRKLKLVSCHLPLEQGGNYLVTELGGQAVSDKERAALLARQSEAFRRHRIAFEKILHLALERTRVRLSPPK